MATYPGMPHDVVRCADTRQSDRRALNRLVSRIEREARWSQERHEYVLPSGAVQYGLGNAAATGVQLRHLLDRHARTWSAASRAYYRRD